MVPTNDINISQHYRPATVSTRYTQAGQCTDMLRWEFLWLRAQPRTASIEIARMTVKITEGAGKLVLPCFQTTKLNWCGLPWPWLASFDKDAFRAHVPLVDFSEFKRPAHEFKPVHKPTWGPGI